MSGYVKESELVAYCGIYCRLCDYYTGTIRDAARNLREVVKSHSELKLFADTAKVFDFENFVEGLEWISKEINLCVGGCRGGGGWGDCPLRKCCVERGIRFCYECDNFPCETLKRFPKRVEELKEIMEMQLENWVKRKLEQTTV